MEKIRGPDAPFATEDLRLWNCTCLRPHMCGSGGGKTFSAAAPSIGKAATSLVSCTNPRIQRTHAHEDIGQASTHTRSHDQSPKTRRQQSYSLNPVFEEATQAAEKSQPADWNAPNLCLRGQWFHLACSHSSSNADPWGTDVSRIKNTGVDRNNVTSIWDTSSF